MSNIYTTLSVLLNALDTFAERNKSVIGDKWYRYILKETRKIRKRREASKDLTPVEAAAYAFWAYNLFVQFLQFPLLRDDNNRLRVHIDDDVVRSKGFDVDSVHDLAKAIEVNLVAL